MKKTIVSMAAMMMMAGAFACAQQPEQKAQAAPEQTEQEAPAQPAETAPQAEEQEAPAQPAAGDEAPATAENTSESAE